VVTVTLRTVAAAFAAIVNVTVKLVVLATLGVPTAMPVPLRFTLVAPITKFVPVNVTSTTFPATPKFGCTFVNVGCCADGACTVNVCALLVPPNVVTVTLRAVVAAFAAIVNVTVKLVVLVTFGVPTVMPAPLTFTLVAPITKFVPVKVTSTAFPATPKFGCTFVNVGCGAWTVNVCALLVPPTVVTVTLRAVAAAFAAIVNVTVKLVVLVTFGVPTVMPVPLTITVVAPAMKLVPVNVTPTAFPATPEFGCTFVNVGGCAGGACTVNVCALLVPPVVVTVTLRGVAAAFAAIVNVTVKLVGPVTFGVPTVIPVPLTATVVPPITKFVPVNVRSTEFPATAVFGCTFVSVGG
jgi:hypothetical protein